VAAGGRARRRGRAGEGAAVASWVFTGRCTDENARGAGLKTSTAVTIGPPVVRSLRWR